MEHTHRTRVRRLPDRGHYDRETIHSILDAGFLCHIGFVHEGHPVVIPTAYGREGDTVYVHGSSASRMQHNLANGVELCLTVTLLDGLVLARSGFSSSMNYRSVVIFGHAKPVIDPDAKTHALAVITNQILRGRWAEVRPPNAQELKATSVLAIPIHEASAKIRTGPPKDDEEDYEMNVWAGVLPIKTSYGPPEPDPKLPQEIAIPDYIRSLLK
jgi:uncharacterized protein